MACKSHQGKPRYNLDTLLYQDFPHFSILKGENQNEN